MEREQAKEMMKKAIEIFRTFSREQRAQIIEILSLLGNAHTDAELFDEVAEEMLAEQRAR